MERISMSIPPETLKRLDEQAQKERRPRSQMAAIILEDALSPHQPVSPNSHNAEIHNELEKSA